MAKNVVINGVTYSNVPEVDIPIANSEEIAKFYDTSDATLDSGNKMLSGNTAYADGVKYTGSIATKTSSDLTAVYADDITVNGQITFNCDNFCVPENNLTVNVARMVAS